MLRCNILSIFLAFSLLAGAQDWKVVRENSQKAFPKTVAAGNYSGIAHLHDDIYAVVSDKSDSALYFNFRIQVNPKTGELEQVENLGFTERTDGTLNDGKFWQGQEKGFDHEAIVKASDSTLVITSEGYCRLKEFPVLSTSANAPKISYQQNLWESRWGWDKETVTFLHVILSQGIGDGIILHHLLVLLRSNLHLQAVVEFGIRLAWQRIPHLCLAAFLTLLLGNFIIRMHLDREVAVGIDKLDEQWKLIAETLVVLFSEEASLPFCNNLVEALALHLAIGYDAFISWYSRDFPAFSHILLLYVEMLESDNLTATPDGGF